jgi:hypothetical protein
MARRNRRQFSFILIASIALSGAACTRAELVDKADAFDAAIWDSSNKQILLNAVRASQRAPMSFVGFGDVLASPNLSGAAAGNFNFSPAGLTGYSLTPAVTYNGGFSSFTINNLNHSDFMKKMQDPITDALVQHFLRLNWPKEMVNLLLVHSIELTKAGYALLKERVRDKCDADHGQRTTELCNQIRIDRENDDRCPTPDTAGPNLPILNTAREFCSMNRFQYAMHMFRLLNVEKFPGKYRSPEGILYYLGELIAAQNYSAEPYTPMMLIGTSAGHKLVKLFVVQRGISPNAAVQVYLQGDGFFIPQPQLGSPDEERSLQVLDFVSQAIVMATSKDALPKSNAVSLVTVH